jgi:hypothetical protein
MQYTHRLLGCASALALALVACSDDSSGGEIDAGRDAAATLPVPDGGGGGAPPPPPQMSDDYTLAACPGAMPPAMVELITALPDCGHICGGGRCVPAELAGSASSQAGLLPKCDDGSSLCIPVKIAETGGNFKFNACTSMLDPNMKGACVPTCIVDTVMPGIAATLMGLGGAGCGMGEVCTPCVSPLDMQPTMACDLLSCGPGGGDDAGSEEDAGATDGG